MHPEYWSEFLRLNALVGREVCIPEEQDESELGAELKLYDEEASREEAEEYYPGIAVASDGFVPVATCISGSGNPYLINTADGSGGPLYRIYHESVAAEPYDRSDAVAVVLPNYEQLLRFVDT